MLSSGWRACDWLENWSERWSLLTTLSPCQKFDFTISGRESDKDFSRQIWSLVGTESLCRETKQRLEGGARVHGSPQAAKGNQRWWTVTCDKGTQDIVSSPEQKIDSRPMDSTRLIMQESFVSDGKMDLGLGDVLVCTHCCQSVQMVQGNRLADFRKTRIGKYSL